MGGAKRHCHCKASNFCSHAQVLPGAQVIKIPFVLSDVGKFIKIFKNLPQKNLAKMSETINRSKLKMATWHH